MRTDIDLNEIQHSPGNLGRSEIDSSWIDIRIVILVSQSYYKQCSKQAHKRTFASRQMHLSLKA